MTHPNVYMEYLFLLRDQAPNQKEEENLLIDLDIYCFVFCSFSI